MIGLNTFTATTLIDLLQFRADSQPEQSVYTFLVDGETEAVSLTYRELDRQAKRIAVYLRSYCQPGERALLLYPPGLEYIAAFYGCLYAGIVAVPAYPPRPNRSLLRLQSIIKDAQAKVALTTRAEFDRLERRFAQAPELRNLYWLSTEVDSCSANQWRAPDIASDTLAFLQYTSGSTAAPKGVMITHRNLLHNLEAIRQYFESRTSSRGVIWLPPYHDMGLIGGILQPLYSGSPVVLMSPLMFLQSPIRWLQAISRYRASVSGGPNFAYELCIRKVTDQQVLTLDLSRWDVAFNGAEPINYSTIERFAEKFAPGGFRREAFYPCYGMAEATLIVSGGTKTAPPVAQVVCKEALQINQVVPATVNRFEIDSSRDLHVLVGCGRSIPEQKIVIAHPEKLMQCAEDQIGEIWISGPSIARGYWNQPETTDRAFSAYLVDTEEGPFLRTGDLGFIRNGELFVTGRLKDMIIINGRNYYPQDIEQTVEQNHPQLRANCCASFSVSVSGEEKLAIVAEVERTYQSRRPDDRGASESSVHPYLLVESIGRAVVQEHDLQVHKVLLLKPGSIPKTSSGKIQRHECRLGFLNGTLEAINGTR
ncbi:MAG: fatty acyl-AMP ligase [Cyanophyceae cyanobacterium]